MIVKLLNAQCSMLYSALLAVVALTAAELLRVNLEQLWCRIEYDNAVVTHIIPQ